MALRIVPVFKSKLTRGKLVVRGKALGREFETLDRLAGKHGLTLLTAFMDNCILKVAADADRLDGPRSSMPRHPAKG
jgi:hypothetical protein